MTRDVKTSKNPSPGEKHSIFHGLFISGFPCLFKHKNSEGVYEVNMMDARKFADKPVTIRLGTYLAIKQEFKSDGHL
jgi:hypothetical protein